jgi:hypothetical protein
VTLRRWFPPGPVVVCLTSGKVFRGMGRAERGWVILTDVDRLADNGNSPVRGELRVPGTQIEFLQLLPATMAATNGAP